MTRDIEQIVLWLEAAQRQATEAGYHETARVYERRIAEIRKLEARRCST